MNDNCPFCKGTGKEWNKVIGFAYDIILITLDEYKNNKNTINNLIDIKSRLAAEELKERIKDGGEEYYNKLMSEFEEEVI